MKMIETLRDRFERKQFAAVRRRLRSIFEAGIGCTILLMFAGIWLHDRKLPISSMIVAFGCLGVLVTIVLVAAYSILGAVEATIYTTRNRFRRILGAWLLTGGFAGGALFIGYQLGRAVYALR